MVDSPSVTQRAAFLLYFGCWDKPGHYLYAPTGYTLQYDGVPTLALRGEDLDGSRLFLPWPEIPGQGQLTHVIRGLECVTVLAWWDRTFDQRGRCNAAIQCDGWELADRLWVRFSAVYSALAQKLKKPELVI